MRAGVIDQDAPHHLTRDAEELPAVLPHHPPLIDQPHIRLVHERRRLQRVPAAFAAQLPGRPAAQLLIHDRHELVAGGAVACGPGMEQRRHVVTGRGHWPWKPPHPAPPAARPSRP